MFFCVRSWHFLPPVRLVARLLLTCHAFHNRRDSSPLDQFSHPALTPAVAALHGYAASGGDTVFLERSYEFARTVAASKQDLGVAFDACRLALAVG